MKIVAPTEQELINAGFQQSRRTGIDYYYFSYSKEINDNLILVVDGSDTGIWYKNENKSKLIHPIELTKAAINAEFEALWSTITAMGKTKTTPIQLQRTKSRRENTAQ